MKKLSNFLAATALLVAVGHASAADQVVKIGYQNEPDPSHAAIVASDYEKAPPVCRAARRSRRFSSPA